MAKKIKLANLISQDDVERHYGIPKSTLRDWVRKGYISHTLIGGAKGSKKFYFINELEEMFAINLQKRTVAALEKFKQIPEYNEEEKKWIIHKSDQFLKAVPIPYLFNFGEKADTILHLAWKERKTLTEIGIAVNLSKERVRQILDKTLRRMPNRIMTFIGQFKKMKSEYEPMKERMRQIEKENFHLHLDLDKLRSKIRNAVSHPFILSTRIEEHDFTLRLRRILLSAKMVTISDIYQYRKSDLMKLPDFGRRALDELEEFALANYLQWPDENK